jgi:hypothetical protein
MCQPEQGVDVADETLIGRPGGNRALAHASPLLGAVGYDVLEVRLSIPLNGALTRAVGRLSAIRAYCAVATHTKTRIAAAIVSALKGSPMSSHDQTTDSSG